jgi:PHP domain
MTGHPGDHTYRHHDHDEPTPEFLDETIPDSELRPSDLSRRAFLRRLGLLGAAAASASVLGGTAAAASEGPRRLLWLAGDHHTHTQYSSDAQYKTSQQVQHAAQFGLSWLAITDHGRDAHEKVAIDKIHPDLLGARHDVPQVLTFQGLEWNIPAAEHGTVMFAPASQETALLHEFERQFDGVVTATTASTAANEARAVEAIRWLGDQVAAGRTPDRAVFGQPPGQAGLRLPARDPRLARRRPHRGGRHGGHARASGRGDLHGGRRGRRRPRRL